MLAKIFEEYGGAIKTVVVLLLIIGIVVVLLATDGPVKTAFTDLLSSFFTKASTSAGIWLSAKK